MAWKDKNKEKEYRAYWEKHMRSEESKQRKKETTRLWILNQRKKRAERELQNGADLGYPGIKIRDDIRKRIEEGRTKILVNKDGSITCFHKHEDGHWVNGSKNKKYLHREIVKKELNLTDEDMKGLIVHHKDKDKNNNAISNLEILTQSEHMKKHIEEVYKNFTPGWGPHNRICNKTYDKICVKCGMQFQSKCYNAKYCSTKCKNANRKK